MSEKKTIKIQTDSKKAKNREIEPESTTPDEQIINGGDDPVRELEAKLEAKEKEAEETYDRLLRASAEFDNFKKRSSREMEEFRKYANQSLLKEMLSVVDNLELAISSSNEDKKTDKNLIEGSLQAIEKAIEEARIIGRGKLRLRRALCVFEADGIFDPILA